jgi:hypothetical protein
MDHLGAMIQIKAVAQTAATMAHGIKTDFQHRSCRDRDCHSQRRGCARHRPVVRLVNARLAQDEQITTA